MQGFFGAFPLGGVPFLPGSARSFRELRVIPYIYKGLRLRFCAVSRPNPSRCFARLGPPVPFGGPNLRAVRSPCKIFLLFFRKKEGRTAPLRRTRLPAFCCFCLHRSRFFRSEEPFVRTFFGKITPSFGDGEPPFGAPVVGSSCVGELSAGPPEGCNSPAAP